MTPRAVWRDWTADIRAVLADRERRWLHAAVLCTFALLPYNAFGITLPRAFPVLGTSVKFTEIAFFLVVIAVVHALLTHRLRILRAPVLYAFLILNAVAQFTALPIAGDRTVLFTVGIAVARYSILVALLVNVLRSDRLLRAVLTVFAGTTIVFGAMTLVRYFRAGGELEPWDIAAVLGSSVPHILAYAAIFFGVGLVYWFVRMRYVWWVTVGFLVVLALWMQLVFIAYVKIGQIVLAIFLALLVLSLHARRREAFVLCAIFVIVAAYNFHVVAIYNGAIKWRVRIAEQRSLRLNRHLAADDAPRIDTDAVAGALRTRVMDTVALLGAIDTTTALAPPSSTTTAIAPPSSTTTAIAPPSSTTTAIAPPSSTVPTALAPIASVVPVREVSIYDGISRSRWYWSKASKSSSLSVRRRGMAVAWLIGTTYPWTGIGVGQMSAAQFDAFSNQVRAASQGAFSRWKRLLFTNEDLYITRNADKGIFNIFGIALAETGFPGLFALLGMLSVVIVQGLRAVWYIRRSRGVHAIGIFFPLFLGLLLYHQMIYMWVHPWFWSALALTYAAARVVHDGEAVRASS